MLCCPDITIAGTTVQKDVLQELGTHSIVWQHTTFVPGSLYMQQPGKVAELAYQWKHGRWNISTISSAEM